jgi:microcystin-dependent protein
MGTQYFGEIRIVSFSFAPKGWAQCNGQTMSIQQNTALFSLLGTTYGGDGITNFMLPDFRGRTANHVGQVPGGGPFTPGQRSGEEAHTLVMSEMPQHTHFAIASTAGPTIGPPTGSYWATNISQYSSSTPNTPMAANAIGPNGSSQPHANWPPYLVLNFIIALTGIFPSRN